MIWSNQPQLHCGPALQLLVFFSLTFAMKLPSSCLKTLLMQRPVFEPLFKCLKWSENVQPSLSHFTTQDKAFTNHTSEEEIDGKKRWDEPNYWNEFSAESERRKISSRKLSPSLSYNTNTKSAKLHISWTLSTHFFWYARSPKAKCSIFRDK